MSSSKPSRFWSIICLLAVTLIPQLGHAARTTASTPCSKKADLNGLCAYAATHFVSRIDSAKPGLTEAEKLLLIGAQWGDAVVCFNDLTKCGSDQTNPCPRLDADLEKLYEKNHKPPKSAACWLSWDEAASPHKTSLPYQENYAEDIANALEADQRIRAPLVRWLLIDPEAAKRMDPRGIQIFGARIDGKLDLAEAELTRAVRIEFSAIPQGIRLAHAITRYFDLDGSWLGEQLEAHEVTVHGSFNLKDGFKATSGVYLDGAKIDGDLDCRGGNFFVNRATHQPKATELSEDLNDDRNAAFDGHGIKVSGSVRFGAFDQAEEGPGVFLISKLVSSHFDGVILLSRSVIDNNVDFHHVIFVGSGTTGLAQEESTVKGGLTWQDVTRTNLDLVHTSLSGALNDDPKSWPSNGHLRVDGLTYTGISQEQVSGRWHSRLSWLDLMPTFYPQPYRQLADIANKSGNDILAKKALITMEERRCNEGELDRWDRTSCWFLGPTISYGYRPYRVLWALLFFVSLGWLLVHLGKKSMRPTETANNKTTNGGELEGNKLPDSVSANSPNSLSPFWYSLNVFLPVINLNQEKHWWPDSRVPWSGGWWLRIFLWCSILAGWLTGTLLLASLTGLIQRP